MGRSKCRGAWSMWTPAGRLVVFALAATSIWCLLAEFYGVCSMRAFTLWVSLPAMVALATLAMATEFAETAGCGGPWSSARWRG